jgi:hypothetical protein
VGFSPSNFDRRLIDAGAFEDVDVTDGERCIMDTDALTFSCGSQSFRYAATVVAQDGGAQAAVFTVGAFKIRPAVIVDAVGSRPLIVDARGEVDIEGQLRASGLYVAADGGGFVPPSGSLYVSPGEGYYGSEFCGKVGRPIPATIHPYGTSDLQPLMGGSGGSLASGGGAVQITSLVKVTVGKGGLINTNGMGGARGPGMDHGFNYGGAGSGGAILLEAPAVTMAGGLAANGGGRFDGGTSPGVGQAPGCDDPSLGGAGSVGDDPNGEAGSDQFCLGGGGAGWIAVRARACEFTGVVSPSLKSGCAHGFLMESK